MAYDERITQRCADFQGRLDALDVADQERVVAGLPATVSPVLNASRQHVDSLDRWDTALAAVEAGVAEDERKAAKRAAKSAKRPAEVEA